VRVRQALTTASMFALFIWHQGTCFGRQPANQLPQEAVYRYGTDGVQLEGVLTERTFYGPPGFGETPKLDVRDKVLLLKLSRPITVEPSADTAAKDSENLDSFRHIHNIQLLLLNSSPADARKMVGKPVIVVGTLVEGLAPGQHTNVCMQARTLSLK